MDEEVLVKEEEKEFSRRYKLSLWWVEHRDPLKKLGLIIFAVIDGMLLLFGLWVFVDSYLISYNPDILAVEQMASLGQADLHAYTKEKAAVPLEIGTASVFAAGEGNYDFYAPVTNVNADWWAEFSYSFTLPEGETRKEKGFILPEEGNKPFVMFSVESATPPRAPTFVMTELVWHRVDHHAIGAYLPFREARLNLNVKDIAVLPATEGDGKAPPRVMFTVENRSAFGYYEPAFIVLLKRGPSVVGVNRTILSRLDAGGTAAVTVNWFGTLPGASSAVIVPEINLFDQSVYQPASP